ncbi:hypothetical protein [Sulfitobacter sp. 1A12057]|uniref:hypothetical protein n=1 Tax=Sulfitobacter sp. 1A12057 TaxID=3368567 RepID=UPI003746A87B
MTSNVTRLVYAPHIQDIYTRAGVSSVYVPHPCVRPSAANAAPYEWHLLVEGCANQFRRVAFSPSASVPLESIEALAEQDPDTLFVCKSRERSGRPNVLCHGYFKDYVEALAQCDLVCVPFAPEHKVSGPAFEAIAMGKAVILLPNAFGHYMKTLFADHSLFPGEVLPAPGDAPAVGLHNDKIVKALLKLVTRP